MYQVMKFKYFIVLLVVLVACNQKQESSLMNEKVTLNSAKDVAMLLKADELITFDDLRFFNIGLIQLTDSTDNITVGEIIKIGRDDFRSRQFNELMRTVNQFEIRNNLKVQIPNFQMIPETNNLRIYFKFNNLSDKKLTKIDGIVKINNTAGRAISINTGNLLLEVEPLQEVTMYYDIPEQFRQQAVQLIGGSLKNLAQIEWFNKSIEFEDGQKISLETE